jgi:hypothetical protein
VAVIYPSVRGGPPAPCGTYTHLRWPELGRSFVGFDSLEWELTPELDTSHGYFWAHQFALRASGTPPSGGYAGLQANGAWADGPAKVAIFSIWNAVAARGDGIARPFGGEGCGYQTLIRWPWIAGRAYALRVGALPDEPERTWWAATVRDTVTGKEAEVGRILVPERWDRLDTWSVVWTELFSPPIRRCEDMEPVSSLWSHFSANGGRVEPLSLDSRFGDPARCGNSSIEAIAPGVIRQQMGIAAAGDRRDEFRAVAPSQHRRGLHRGFLRRRR